MNFIPFLTLLMLGCFMPFNSCYSSKEDLIVDKILSKTMATIEKKYPLKGCGSGAAMPGGPIRELTICFSSRNLNRDELRFMLIKCAQECLKEVHATDSINDYLFKPPFKISDIQVIIYNHDQNGRDLFDPFISASQIARGKLTYDTVDPSNHLRYKNSYTETYDEALKLLEKP